MRVTVEGWRFARGRLRVEFVTEDGSDLGLPDALEALAAYVAANPKVEVDKATTDR